jgi:hypothetical protein
VVTPRFDGATTRWGLVVAIEAPLTSGPALSVGCVASQPESCIR